MDEENTIELKKQIQQAVMYLSYRKMDEGETIRDRWIHIDDIRKYVENKNRNRWVAETITRMVRKMYEEGYLERKAPGIYGLALSKANL